MQNVYGLLYTACVRIFWKVLLATVLAYAWTWTTLLKDLGTITDKERVTILVILGITFVVQQIWLNLPQRANRSDVDDLRELAENCLEGLLSAYYDEIEKLKPGSDPQVRANLSLPTHGKFFKKCLKIHFQAFPQKAGPYSAQELAKRWKKGEGAIGHVWKHADAIGLTRWILDSTALQIRWLRLFPMRF